MQLSLLQGYLGSCIWLYASETELSEITETGNQPPAKRKKLSSKEIEDIIMGNDLSDTHINMAQNLLKAQFPLLNGLNSTLLQGKQKNFHKR